MSLWFNLRCNADRVGTVEIQRREWLDLSDTAAIADAISTYDVRLDGRPIGTLTHRYGNGAWSLLAKAADMIAGVDA